MVEIAVVLDGTGCISRMNLTGHAGDDPAGSNPACAAVTLVARSVARLVASRTGWTVDGAAPGPGNLSLEIRRRPEDTDEWLGGVTETLMQALADIEAEYPDSMSVSIEEKINGS